MREDQPMLLPLRYQDMETRIGRVYQRYPGDGVQNTLLLFLIKHLWKGITAAIEENLVSQRLGHVAFLTLFMLDTHPNGRMCPSELSEWVGETRSNMTRICDELVRAGLVMRRPCGDDRRRVYMALSDAGRALLGQRLPVLRACLDERLAVLDEGESQSLHVLLQKLMATSEAGK